MEVPDEHGLPASDYGRLRAPDLGPKSEARSLMRNVEGPC
jgi:hypothetical protein